MSRFYQKRDFSPRDPPAWTGIWPQTVNHMRLVGRPTPWRVPYYCFQLVLSDNVRFYSQDSVDTMLPVGAVFLIEPETPFCYHAPDDSLVHIYALRLVGPHVEEFVTAMGFSHSRLWFPAAAPREVYNILEALMRLAIRRDPAAAHLAVATLHRLPLHTGSKPRQPLVGRDFLGQVLDHLDNHLDLGENVDQLAARFGISRHTLFGKFKERFGESPVKIIIRRRLERAKALLRTTAFDIADVARLSGYGSPEHFQRQFRKHEGKAPGQWRQDWITGEHSDRRTPQN